MRCAAVLFLAFACSGAFASEPGQPLDCRDWVFLTPGLSCAPWVAANCAAIPQPSSFCTPNLSSAVFDNEGRQYAFRTISGGASCCAQPGVCNPCNRFAVVRYDGANESIVAYLDTRPNGAGGVDTLSASPVGVDFDRNGGRLILWLASESNGDHSQWAAAIGGFSPLFDVLQSFTPQAAAFGFRVPYMPEAMAGADHFDTYWGNLAHPIDFTQAHPLQCGYPAAAPHVGDYLTVADTVPTPSPGQGVYFVTSATYQGASRYGRNATAGHLSGRDPALLPACTP
jgi:hypothetical protein